MKHFIFDNIGSIREFSHDESLKVANGLQTVPEFAGREIRYLQVQVVHPEDVDENRVEVRMAGTKLTFDDGGQLQTAEALEDEGEVSLFERETCAELALQGEELGQFTLN